MGGCNFFTIVNTGATPSIINFTDCDLINPHSCSLTLEAGETYYVNSTDTLTSIGDLVIDDDGTVSRYLDFSGYCGGNFSLGFRLGTTTAFTFNNVYCFSSVTNCDGDVPLDLPKQCFKLILSGGTPTYQLASIVSYPNFDGDLVDCIISYCPCASTPTPTPTLTETPTPTPTLTETPTPTPTQTETPTPTPTPTLTETPTPTPTPTPTEPNCETDYCITNTGFDYDDNYQITGIHNGKDYWVGAINGYYIYYNNTNTQWCLSDALDGTCFLFGKSPCTSTCPDLCDEYFNNGICLTPTPTPTINCDVFDFQAIFNCEVPTSPTPTPTNTATPTTTPTPTPTDVCGYLTLSVSVENYTPTPTATPTNTPTQSPQVDRPFNFSGDVTFNTLEASILCPESLKFQDCYNGNLYFTTNSLLVPNGGSLQPFMIFKANVDGEVKCISFLETNTQTIGVNDIELLEGPVGYSNLGECVFCTPEVTKTPTPTPTSTNTPTPTQTSTNTPTPTQTSTSTPTPTPNSTTTPTPTMTQTPTMTSTNTPTPTPTQTQPQVCKCYKITDYDSELYGATQISYKNCSTNTITTITTPKTPNISFQLHFCSKTTPTKIFGAGNLTQVSVNCDDCCRCYYLDGLKDNTIYDYYDCNGDFQTVTVIDGTTISVCASVFPTRNPASLGDTYVYHPLGNFPLCTGAPKVCPP